MELENWFLIAEEDKNIIYIMAYGNVKNSFKFKENSFIRTSSIKKIKLIEDKKMLIIKTNSSSIYQLDLEKMNKKYLKTITKSLDFLDKNISNQLFSKN
jgi:mRNA degradation ribonuclease J1/J2